jgi:hypothetical protein
MTLLSGCGVYYTQPSKTEPHAIVDFQQGSGFLNLKGTNFVILSLNGKRPERWVPGNNTEERYRVAFGPTRIFSYIYGDDRNRRAESDIYFVAKQGVTYDVTARDDGSTFFVQVTPRGSAPISTQRLEKRHFSHPAPVYIPIPVAN